jgi:hypothetical protein
VRVHDYTPRKGNGYIAAFLTVSGGIGSRYEVEAFAEDFILLRQRQGEAVDAPRND